MASACVPAAAVRVRDLRLQHRLQVRVVYDGHNRRSGLTSKHRYALRRTRRRWRQRLLWMHETHWSPRRMGTNFFTSSRRFKPTTSLLSSMHIP
jgi:hypothetical protein